MLSSVLSIGRAYSYLINFIKDLYSTIQILDFICLAFGLVKL